MNGSLTISLDFELLWGVRDHFDRNSYGVNIIGARKAIPRMLDLFSQHNIHVTWATVGFLFCESKDELIASLPDFEEQPKYINPALSNYNYIDDVGNSEKDDPYHFAPSLLQKITETPGQEIATHTFSHYYCLEDGASIQSFAADMKAAIRLAKRRGITLRSIVFPRNQYSDEHLVICENLGISTFRGNPKGWIYRSGKLKEQTATRRGMRLIDSYSGILSAKSCSIRGGDFKNVPANRFLRPCAGRLAIFHPLHLRVIRKEMEISAYNSMPYHLWWHPHNFGHEVEANLNWLTDIIHHYAILRDKYDFASKTMSEYCNDPSW